VIRTAKEHDAMTIEPRLVVTGREADGTSVFVADKPADPTTIAAFPGTTRHAHHRQHRLRHLSRR
jgi:hypothetical protein